jgi:hypothetical protein
VLKVRVGEALEFLELGFEYFRDRGDIKVIAGSVVGHIPGSIEVRAEDFGLETLDTSVGEWLCISLISSEGGV